MTDYIKREDAIQAFDPLQRQDWYTPWIVETLEDLPSADVAPVRHGHWIKNDPHCDGLAFLWNCSECGGESDEGYRYCPACGARMDGESDE